MPPTFRLPLRQRATRTLVLWLLAVVLPLQGVAVGVLAALGPLHVHRAVVNAPIVLDDFRHWKSQPVVAETHGFGMFAHVHGGAAAQRHHHALGDASVVTLADDAPGAADAIGLAGLALLAPAPLPAPWHGVELAGDARPRAPWSSRSGHVEPLDRPPKQG